MLALRWKEQNDVRLENIPESNISTPDEIKIKVSCAAVCATDFHIARGAFGDDFPRTLGHEISGEVIETGSAVSTFKPGDLVALQPTIWCGKCGACEDANYHLCSNRKFIGLNHDGGFAEYMVAPERNFIKIPKTITLKDACFIEPLACVLHGIERISPGKKDSFVITGAGPSAYLFVAVLLSKGITPDNILVSGRRDIRLSLIEKLGVETVDVRKHDFFVAVDKKFGRHGPTCMIDQTGDIEIMSRSIDLLARQGTLFVYDYMGEPILFDFGKMQLRETTILTSTGCTQKSFTEAIRLLEEKKININKLITHEFTKKEMLTAFKKGQKKDQTHMKSVFIF